jgi:hypothetical protein
MLRKSIYNQSFCKVILFYFFFFYFSALKVRQYGNYKINGKSLNGKQTLGENIADNGYG